MAQNDGRTLSDGEITTRRRHGRRAFLGLAFGGGALTLAQAASAQVADADAGAMTDPAACPRGPGGSYTGVTDSDDGQTADLGGYGRGPIRC